MQTDGLYFHGSPSAMPTFCSVQPPLAKTHQPPSTAIVRHPAAIRFVSQLFFSGVVRELFSSRNVRALSRRCGKKRQRFFSMISASASVTGGRPFLQQIPPQNGKTQL